MISIQENDFDVGAEYRALTAEGSEAGAVVTFIGRVRDINLQHNVVGLHIEHYPGMTEKALQDIIAQARVRWNILRCRIIHRVGDLHISDNIVFVGVTSKHREDAFRAAEFMMDYLKTQAPFWKKELTTSGEIWLGAQEKDLKAAERWK